jgi:drug/metabolite transporter (DMT)-like permease
MASSRTTRLALAGTVLLWAVAFPAIKVGLDGFDVAGLSILRLLVAAGALALVAPLLGVRRPRVRDLGWVALCGASGMSAYQLLLNWGEVHVPAGTASLLISVAPVFSVLLAAGFLGERVGVRVGIGSLVAVGGSALIALSGGEVGYSAAAWVVLAAAAVQGLYHAASRPLLARYTPLEVACYATWSGALFLSPLAPAALGDIPSAGPGPVLAIGFLGLLPSALGFVLWGYAVSRSTMSTATAALYLVPVVAIAVSFGWLGELPTAFEIVGGLVSMAGVAIIQGVGRRRVGGLTADLGGFPGRRARRQAPGPVLDGYSVRPEAA